MFKFVILVLALLAVASAQYIASPYYRTGAVGYGAYPYAGGYSGYGGVPAYGYGGLGYRGAFLG